MQIKIISLRKKIIGISKEYLKLSKAGITLFALISAAAGYVFALQNISFQKNLITQSTYSIESFAYLMLGLWLVISGSFACNQSMEWKLDALMKRTILRPVPAGKMTTMQAFALGIVQTIPGLFILLMLGPLTASLALLALILYNICYTIFWKKKWVFAAVPGAIPGALPVVIGYSAVSSTIFSIECLYLFFILFLWQMPHFWSLALHYKEDYKAAGLPVLPTKLGTHTTIRYIGIYLIAYLGMVLIAPLFLKMNILYLLCMIPLCIKLFIEFLKFIKGSKWHLFFLWLNFSILAFLWIPIMDQWLYSLTK